MDRIDPPVNPYPSSPVRKPRRDQPTLITKSVAAEQRLASKVRRTTDFAVADNTATVIPWTTEVFDYGGLHDNSVNNSRFTIPGISALSGSKSTGVWIIQTQIEWEANATGYRTIRIIQNGATTLSQVDIPSPGAASSLSQASIVYVLDPAIEDYYEVQVVQTSGGNLNVANIAGVSFFEIIHLW